MRNAQANHQPPKSRGIRNKTLLSLSQEYSRNRPNRLTNQKYVLSGFVTERLPPQVGDGQFPSYVTSDPLADCREILLLLKGFKTPLIFSWGFKRRWEPVRETSSGLMMGFEEARSLL